MGKHLHVHRLDVHWQLVDLILQVPQYIMRLGLIKDHISGPVYW